MKKETDNKINKDETRITKNSNSCFDNLKRFINKDNFVKTKLLLFFILACVVSVVLEYTIFRQIYVEYISKIRMIIVTLMSYFVFIHFVFKLDKMYLFIHKYRYALAALFMIFVMTFKLSGTSIVNYNSIVQDHNDDRKYHTVLGTGRLIRTDEWATSTTYILSQAKSTTPFSYFSDTLRGSKTDMFTVANSIVLDILMLGRPFQIGFMLFGNDMGLSFYWYIRILAMLLGSYELFLVLTKGNKRVSLAGMIVMTYSAATQWWYCLDVVIWGQIAIVLIDKFLKADKKWIKYLCAFGLVVAGMSYIFIMYPAWQLPFGYVYLALVIYLLIDNFKYGEYKLNIHDIIVILITIMCIAGLAVRWYSLSKDTIEAMNNTDYPGVREEIGGGAINNYSYYYNIYFTREDFLNPCEYAGMISLFPVPLYLAAIYMFRNKKNLHFLIPMFIVAMFLMIYCIYGLPLPISRLTRMSISTAGRSSIPLGVACIYLFMFMLGTSNEEDKVVPKWMSYVLAVIFAIFIGYNAEKNIGYKDIFVYLNPKKMVFSAVLFGLPIWGLFNLNNEKIKKFTCYILMLIALISGFGVNPIISSTNVFYTKPVAIKMNEIKNEDPNAIWIVNDEGWYLNNYPLASGIKVINSTALYPNKDMYITLFGEEKALSDEIRTIYNRYCHINGNITNEETSIELLHEDNIKLNLNYNDISKLNIKYILSTKDLNQENLGVKFEELYNEDGMYIFKADNFITIEEVNN